MAQHSGQFGLGGGGRPPLEQPGFGNDDQEELREQDGAGTQDEPHKGRTSAFRGVCWHKKSKKWQAAINSSGRHVYLGSFDTQEEAARMFDKVALMVRGARARLNFPMSQYRDLDLESDHRLEQLVQEARKALDEKICRQGQPKLLDGLGVDLPARPKRKAPSSPSGGSRRSSDVEDCNPARRPSNNTNPIRAPGAMAGGGGGGGRRSPLSSPPGGADGLDGASDLGNAFGGGWLGPQRHASALGLGIDMRMVQHGPAFGLDQPQQQQRRASLLSTLGLLSGAHPDAAAAAAGGPDASSQPATAAHGRHGASGRMFGSSGATGATGSSAGGSSMRLTAAEQLAPRMATLLRHLPPGASVEYAVPCDHPDLAGFIYTMSQAPFGAMATRYGAGVFYSTTGGCKDLGCYSTPADAVQACQACLSVTMELIDGLLVQSPASAMGMLPLRGSSGAASAIGPQPNLSSMFLSEAAAGGRMNSSGAGGGGPAAAAAAAAAAADDLAVQLLMLQGAAEQAQQHHHHHHQHQQAQQHRAGGGPAASAGGGSSGSGGAGRRGSMTGSGANGAILNLAAPPGEDVVGTEPYGRHGGAASNDVTADSSVQAALEGLELLHQGRVTVDHLLQRFLPSGASHGLGLGAQRTRAELS